MAGYGEPLLLDSSAYARVLLAAQRDRGTRLSASQLRTFEDAVEAGEVYVCPPFRLEAQYSARDRRSFAAMEAVLEGFEQADADTETFALALGAQRDLATAKGVSHRVKAIDLLVAAIAHQHGLGVLHYDADYDVLSRRSRLEFKSRWIAARGSVD